MNTALLSSAAASFASTFTTDTIAKTDPMTIVAFVCCVFQLLFAFFMYSFMAQTHSPTVINMPMTRSEPVVEPVPETARPLREEPETLPPIRIPNRDRKKELRHYLADGQPIRHRLRGHDYFYGAYIAATNRIVCTDGAIVKSLSGFAVYNMRQTNPNAANPQADGWTRCEVQIEDGSWVKANTLAIV